MTKHLETKNDQLDDEEHSRQIIEIVLSNVPEGMSEQTSMVLFDLCFQQAGAVGSRYGLSSEAVRQIKYRHKDVFNTLKARKGELGAKTLEAGVWDGIRLVTRAYSQMPLPKTPNALSSLVTSLIQVQSLANTLRGSDKSISNEGDPAIIKGIEALKAQMLDKLASD